MAEPVPSPRSLLVGSRISDLIPSHQTVITLRQDQSIEQALQTLAAKRILSAPVFSQPSDTDAKGDILGFVDIRDILSSFLKIGVDPKTLDGTKMLQRMRLLEEAGQAFASRPLSDLPDMGGDGDFVLANGRTNRLTVMELVHDGFLYPRETKAIHGGSRSRTIVHRIGVYTADGEVTNIVSQSDIIRFLLERSKSLGDLAKHTVAELGWGNRAVVSVPPEMPAIDAMSLMDVKGISAVPVVASSGKIIGNFSVSDLRTICAEHFGSLALPVGEFLALEHGVAYKGYAITSADEDFTQIEASSAHQFAKLREKRRREIPGEEVGQQLITCTATDTLSDVLLLLVRCRLHRLYVVDELLRPVGLITLTDVLKKVIKESQL